MPSNYSSWPRRYRKPTKHDYNMLRWFGVPLPRRRPTDADR